MKIVNVKPVTGEIIEIEGRAYTTYRRSSDGSWMVLMGESWESCYSNEEELEAAYQAYKARLNG